jgi:hypothetical protein
MKKILRLTSVALLLSFAVTQNASSEKMLRLGEVKRGDIHDFSAVTLTGEYAGQYRPSNQFVVAMQDSESKLRLMVWEVSGAGNPMVIANLPIDGTIKDVSVARASSRRIVVAVRDSDDKLRLIAFDISTNGTTITRLGTKVSQKKIREVDIAGESYIVPLSAPSDRVFTAASDSNGMLFVADWKVKQDGNLRHLGTEIYGPANQIVAENGATGFNSVLTAMRDADDSLRMIAFQLTTENGVKRRGLGTGGKIREVKSSGYTYSGDLYTATISDYDVAVWGGLTPIDRYWVDAGRLKIIRWAHKGNGRALVDIASNDLERKAEREITSPDVRSDGYTEGMAETLGIMNFFSNISGFNTEFVTAHAGFGTFKKLRRENQGKPKLRIIAWGENLNAISKATLGGEYTKVELVPLPSLNESARFVTVLRGIRGELKVVVWAMTL